MPSGDVYGALLADVCAGKRAMEIVERSDGYVMAFDARYLVAPFRKWDDADERRAMRFVRRRVLDVGCGGGRVCLHLQERGLDVVGIDSSPEAIACSRQRGVRDARVLTIDAIDDSHALDEPVHRRYRDQNHRRGRLPRQLRVRIRYRELATPWLDWLQVSQAELIDLLDGTGWRLSHALGDGPSYVAIIENTKERVSLL